MKLLVDKIKSCWIIKIVRSHLFDFIITVVFAVLGAYISIVYSDNIMLIGLLEGTGASIVGFVPKSWKVKVNAFLGGISGYSDITSEQNMNIFDSEDEDNLFDDKDETISKLKKQLKEERNK